MDKSMELADPSRKITMQDFQHEVGMMKLQRKCEDITLATAKYADEPAGPSDYIAMINQATEAVQKRPSVAASTPLTHPS